MFWIVQGHLAEIGDLLLCWQLSAQFNKEKNTRENCLEKRNDANLSSYVVEEGSYICHDVVGLIACCDAGGGGVAD